MNPAQTIEEIDAHRQKEVLALVPYLDGALRRDVKSVAAALMADLEEYLKKQLEVVKAGGRILEGMHVLAAGDGAKKGVVIRDCGASNNEPYTVRWGDGEESGWLKPADIVLDEAAEERHKEKVKELEEKLEERQAQILRDFDALRDGLGTTEKTSWYTATSVTGWPTHFLAVSVLMVFFTM